MIENIGVYIGIGSIIAGLGIIALIFLLPKIKEWLAGEGQL